VGVKFSLKQLPRPRIPLAQNTGPNEGSFLTYASRKADFGLGFKKEDYNKIAICNLSRLRDGFADVGP